LFAILILGGSITAIYIGTKNPDRSADETSKLSKPPPDKTQLFINQIKDDIANFKGEVLNLKSQHYLKSVDVEKIIDHYNAIGTECEKAVKLDPSFLILSIQKCLGPWMLLSPPLLIL
jgi:hypothetical protein